MSHYDLASVYKETTSDDWKEFLMDTGVQDWIKQEVSMIQDSELKKLLKGVSSSKSIGQAQLMNTLAKLSETKETKEGPVFIYTYVPLNSNEKKASDTHDAGRDVFLNDGT